MPAADRVNAVTANLYHKQGCRFIGDEGWVHVNRGSITAEPKSPLDVKITPEKAHLVKSDNQYLDFLECVRSRRDPVAPVDAGHRASVIGNVADIALRLNRRVRWDPARDQFVGDDQANRLLSRAMREPWTM